MSGPRIGELFAGYGGLGMGVRAAIGGDIAWTSEIDPGACKILAHRFPDLPNHGDITAIDWSSVEPVEVLTGGFPCQDLSLAGLRKGLRPDTRSGLWTHFAYAIDQLRPELVVIENVRGLLSAGAHSDLEPCPWCVGDGGQPSLRALGAVLGDLAGLGYDASWQGLRASDVGAPHQRFRVFVIAWPTTDSGRLRRGTGRLAVAGEAPGGRPLGEPAGRRGAPAADAPCHGRSEGWPEPTRVIRGSDDALSSHDDAPDAHLAGLEGREPAAGHQLSAWGPYGDAVRRWERVTRPAPRPTEPSKTGQPRLSPAFVEWMMGLAAGWVTDVPGLTRNEQLKALGNGVVPQQAAEALRLLLPDIEAVAA